MAIGKVGENGTLNGNGAFYSVQDINTLLKPNSDIPSWVLVHCIRNELNEIHLDKTWNELNEMTKENKIPVYYYENPAYGTKVLCILSCLYHEEEENYVAQFFEMHTKSEWFYFAPTGDDILIID